MSKCPDQTPTVVEQTESDVDNSSSLSCGSEIIQFPDRGSSNTACSEHQCRKVPGTHCRKQDPCEDHDLTSLVDQAVYGHSSGWCGRRWWSFRIDLFAARLSGCRCWCQVWVLLRRHGIFSSLADDFFHLSQPMCLEDLHGWVEIPWFTASSSISRTHLPFSTLVGMEMHPSQVTCGVVTFIVPLSRLACFAVGQEGLIWRSVDGHPHFPRLPVDAVGVSTKLMLTAEAIGVVIANRTFQPKDLSGLALAGRLESRRGCRTINLGSCLYHRLLGRRRVYRIGGLSARRSARDGLDFCSGLGPCWRHWTVRNQGS